MTKGTEELYQFNRLGILLQLEIIENAKEERRPLKELPRSGESEIKRIALDTSVGMVFSNVIAFFIILTTAAVLHASGVTNVRSAPEAAEALRPLAGDLTFAAFL